MCLTLHTPKFHLCQVFFTHPSFIVSCFLLGRDNGEDLLPLVNEYVVSARIAPAIPVMIVTNIKYGVQSVTKVALRYPKAIAIPKRIEKTRIRLSGSAPLTYCTIINTSTPISVTLVISMKLGNCIVVSPPFFPFYLT